MRVEIPIDKHNSLEYSDQFYHPLKKKYTIEEEVRMQDSATQVYHTTEGRFPKAQRYYQGHDNPRMVSILK